MAQTMESWESITNFVIKQGNGVKGLSDLNLKSLPMQFVQPERIREDIKGETNEAIPIWDDPKLADAICDAAETWSFFRIVNHGMPIEVFENVKNATHRFFELPAEEKLKYTKAHSASNNVRVTSSFVPDFEGALEWKDHLSLFYLSEDEASALWPPTCKDQVLEYLKSTEIVIKKLVDVLMKRLNVNKVDETKQSNLMGSTRVNLNYYPICPNPELTIGVGPHSDVSSLTFLLQDEVGGLHVRGRDNRKWIHVPPMNGSIVINIGEALQIMSNGRYKSAEHCVIANGRKNRISVPIFINPKPTGIIGPFPEVIAEGENPIYKKTLYSDYAKHFFRKPHDGKKTIDFIKI